MGGTLKSIWDEGELLVTPSALGEALAGVELDRQAPLTQQDVWIAQITVGPGCPRDHRFSRPLDVKVTYSWLEPLLREWNDGHNGF